MNTSHLIFVLPRRRCNVRSVAGRFALAICLLLAAAGVLAQASVWPRVELPKEVHPFDMGTQLTVNGLPMRMQGFLAAAGPAQVAEWFRRSLGKPLVENRLGNKLILGRAQGDYYLSVQIEAAGGGARGVAAVSDLRGAYDGRSETQSSADRWLAQLPSGSRMVSRVASEDNGRLSNHMVIVNSHDAALNQERLKSMLGEAGYAFEREGLPDERTAAALPERIANGRVLFFRGLDREAMATINRDGNGVTTTVLNTVTRVERFK